MSQIVTTSAADTARSQASERLHAVADASLHQLVDGYVSLTKTIVAGTIEDPTTYQRTFSDEAKVAIQNRNLVNGAARARFGIEFADYDCF